MIILTSDRGFAGGFNANVLREAQSLRALLEGQQVETLTYVAGRKGIGWHRFRGREMADEWSGFSDTPRQENATEIARSLLEAFNRPTQDGGVDEIHVVYTQFVSMLTQQAVVHRLLPLAIEPTYELPPTGPLPIYEFEPSPADVLDSLLPWYVESRIFHALLESAASEIGRASTAGNEVGHG